MRIQKFFFAVLFLWVSAFPSKAHCPQGPDLVGALKEALSQGAKIAVGNLSQKNGFLQDELVKILLPSEAQRAINQLKSNSAGNKIYQSLLAPLVGQLVESLNRSAEDAVSTALPIFGNAIQNITILDGMKLLTGGDDAATVFLKDKTYLPLLEAFKPSISSSLNKKLVLNQSSNEIWSMFTQNYNNVARNPVNFLLNLKPIQETDLGTYVTGKALDGVFLKIATEEKQIRDQPAARTSDLLKDVFGSIGR